MEIELSGSGLVGADSRASVIQRVPIGSGNGYPPEANGIGFRRKETSHVGVIGYNYPFADNNLLYPNYFNNNNNGMELNRPLNLISPRESLQSVHFNSGGESSSSVSPVGAGTRSTAKLKGRICEVCGDVAKSLHFGGLSCDSCKAFFRRSVHKDAYLQFSCGYDNACHINQRTRKSCQKCRFEKCIRIGMEKKWVMTEDERQALNKARLAKKKSVAQHSPSADVGGSGYSSAEVGGGSPSSGYEQNGSGSPTGNYAQSSDSEQATYTATPEESSSFSPVPREYSPNIEDMLNYMSAEEQNTIREICEFYRIAYDRIPYTVPQIPENIPVPSHVVIGLFTTILRRFAFFSKLVPEFKNLEKEDQGNLLKASVLEMVLLRGALSFDIENHRWPNTNLEFLKNCPRLKVEDMKNLVSPELFEMHMSFIQKIQKLKADEPTIMLLLLIVMFYPERSDLEDVATVSAAQEKYCELLRKYVNWRYGPEGSKLYPKLLTQLSDLRQLNDLHTEYHLNLAEKEVSVIRKDLSQLSLDPYPQWKIVNGNDSGSSSGNDESPKVTQESEGSKASKPTSTVRPLRTSTFRAHNKMKEAFLKRIPQLIEDPFCQIMSPEDIMKMASQRFGVPLEAQGSQMEPQLNKFDPWQHRHHPSQKNGFSSSTSPQRSQVSDPNNTTSQIPHFELDKLENIKRIMENLDPETKEKLQAMFTANHSGNYSPPSPASASASASGLTPGLFANLFTAETSQHVNNLVGDIQGTTKE